MVERKYLFFKPMIFSISLNFSIIFSISLLQYNIIQYICHIIISHYRSFCWVEYKNKTPYLRAEKATCHNLSLFEVTWMWTKAAGWFGEWFSIGWASRIESVFAKSGIWEATLFFFQGSPKFLNALKIWMIHTSSYFFEPFGCSRWMI